MIAPTFRVVDQSNYSRKDTLLIKHAIGVILKEFVEQLDGNDKLFEGLAIEVADHRTDELLQYRALGLSYPNRNLDYIPSQLNLFDMTVASGVVSMELAHSIVARLFQNMTVSNDVVHYLYNVQMLKLVTNSNFAFKMWFGGAIKVVVPELAFGIKNKDRIMQMIADGKAPGGPNVYWSAPNSTQQVTAYTAAGEDDYALVKNYLFNRGFIV